VRLVFLGSPPFGTPVLHHLLESRHDVAAVVTPPDRPRGRGRSVQPSSVSLLAGEHGVELVQPASTKDSGFVETLRGFHPDVLVVASYGEILRADVLDLAPHGSLNVHSSLLPRWRGAAPIHRAILAGDAETGVSVQRMVLALDEGDVLLERRTPIGEHETSGELLERLAPIGGEAIVAALDALESGNAVFTPQDPAAVTYAKKLRKEEGWIDWSLPAAQIDRQVRGLNPWPGARTTLPDGRILGLVGVRIVAGEGPPGSLLAGQGLTIATGDGALQLTHVKPAGKGPMKGSDFMNGAHLEPGVLLGEVRP
jgi:methionyl-tRNA formyltransferase